jgi:hypothetical protein
MKLPRRSAPRRLLAILAFDYTDGSRDRIAHDLAFAPSRAPYIPVGRQKLRRRYAAVLGVSAKDNRSLGREGGSHRTIKQCAREIERW